MPTQWEGRGGKDEIDHDGRFKRVGKGVTVTDSGKWRQCRTEGVKKRKVSSLTHCEQTTKENQQF